MADDVIELSTSDQESFAQEKPHFVCQCRGRFRQISERATFEVKCRDPRCSKPCLKNWAGREGRTMAFFLTEYLPPAHTAYRGNLTMPKGSSPAQHRQDRAKFKRALQRRCKGQVAIRAVMHITALDEAHYDFTAYAPDTYSPSEVERAVKDAWEVAGGMRATCKPLDDDSDLDDLTTGWSSYVVKASKTEGDRHDRWRWVPLPLKDGGLDMTFGTHGFFGKGRTADSVHADWVAFHYPKRFKAVFLKDEWEGLEGADSARDPSPTPDPSEPAPRTIGKILSPTPPPSTPSDPPSAESAWSSLFGDKVEVVFSTGDLLQARLDAFQATHPDRVLIVPVRGSYTAPDPDSVLRSDLHMAIGDSPSEAVTVAELTQRTGWAEWQIERALDDLPNFKRIDYTLNRDGVMTRDAWYRQPVQVEPVRPAREPVSGGTLTPGEQAELEAMFADLHDD